MQGLITFQEWETYRNLLADYIENVNHGKIKAVCVPNWKIIGNNWNNEHHDIAVKLIDEGKLSVQDHYARSPNSKSITWKEVRKVISNKK